MQAKDYTASDLSWRLTYLFLGGVIIAPLITLLIIMLGFTNPHPIGEPVFDDQFEGDPTRLFETYQQTPLNLEKSGWSGQDGTVEASLTQLSGVPQSAYGLIWFYGSGESYRYGVSSTGYAGVIEGEDIYHFGWSLYPHVRDQGKINRLRLDFEGILITVMLNDEWVTEIKVENQGLPDSVGVYHAPFNQQDSIVGFERLQVWCSK